jgi:hypothetical protein
MTVFKSVELTIYSYCSYLVEKEVNAISTFQRVKMYERDG